CPDQSFWLLQPWRSSSSRLWPGSFHKCLRSKPETQVMLVHQEIVSYHAAMHVIHNAWPERPFLPYHSSAGLFESRGVDTVWQLSLILQISGTKESSGVPFRSLPQKPGRLPKRFQAPALHGLSPFQVAVIASGRRCYKRSLTSPS